MFARTDTRRTYRFSQPSLRVGGEEYRAIHEILRTGWVSNGDHMRRLEGHFAERFGVKHAILLTGSVHPNARAQAVGADAIARLLDRRPETR